MKARGEPVRFGGLWKMTGMHRFRASSDIGKPDTVKARREFNLPVASKNSYKSYLVDLTPEMK